MTRKDIIHFAKECSSAVYELCMNNPFFNTTECPIGANGLSDVVLNTVLNAFPKTQECASIQQPKGLDEIPKKDWLDAYNEKVDAEIGSSCYSEKGLDEAAEELYPDFSDDFASKAAVKAVRDAFKAGAEWIAGQFQKINGDLEKEAEAYWKAQGGGSHAQWDKFRAVVKHFTKWQKEHIIKEL